MIRKEHAVRRRQQGLSRERIIEASIDLLDRGSETGLTFQALARALATGAGAIYWHIDNKSDLMTAACDTIITATLARVSRGSPEDTIRSIALEMFDAIDLHPWIGSALYKSPGQMPVVRLLEQVGVQVRALGVGAEWQWSAVSALLNYIMGVAGQNATNAQFASVNQLERSIFLQSIANNWSRLDPAEFAFTRSVAGTLPDHDDRADFLAGIDFILAGLRAAIERAALARSEGPSHGEAAIDDR